MSKDLKSGSTSIKTSKWKEMAGVAVAAVGLVASVFSFFPHVTVSDPVQMDPTDFFSYQITITNDGILPIGWAKWALAPKTMKLDLGPKDNNRPVTLLLPSYGEWMPTDDLMASVIKPGAERHAAVMLYPGATAEGSGYGLHLRPVNNSIGTLAPGDQFTFTTEGLMSAPPGATYNTADFAIAIGYTPVFPPIPMQTCANFHIYKDRQGTPHWFKSPNQCDRFPWMHHWFDKSSPRP